MQETLDFQLDACRRLDEFALLARQDYNLGAGDDWFGEFRGGLYGFYARIHGVEKHYRELHTWDVTTAPGTPMSTEYHLASVFFSMDSAVECFTFALNALGNSTAPGQFKNVASAKDLRQIGPSNVTGNDAVPGYSIYFPQLKKHWLANLDLLGLVIELHDVSKHRKVIYHGGKYRDDAPAGYFEAFGIGPSDSTRFLVSPMESIILTPDPKAPISATKTSKPPSKELEELAVEYANFINQSCELAYLDARKTIQLAHQDFIKPHE